MNANKTKQDVCSSNKENANSPKCSHRVGSQSAMGRAASEEQILRGVNAVTIRKKIAVEYDTRTMKYSIDDGDKFGVVDVQFGGKFSSKDGIKKNGNALNKAVITPKSKNDCEYSEFVTPSPNKPGPSRIPIRVAGVSSVPNYAWPYDNQGVTSNSQFISNNKTSKQNVAKTASASSKIPRFVSNIATNAQLSNFSPSKSATSTENQATDMQPVCSAVMSSKALTASQSETLTVPKAKTVDNVLTLPKTDISQLNNSTGPKTETLNRRYPSEHSLPEKNTESIQNRCQYCDRVFTLVRTLHIHQLEYCHKIPFAVKRNLCFKELEHVEKAPLPRFTKTPAQSKSSSISNISDSVRVTTLKPQIEFPSQMGSFNVSTSARVATTKGEKKHS